MKILKCSNPDYNDGKSALFLLPSEKEHAVHYFPDFPELTVYEEVEMDEETFRNMPEFES